MNKKSWPIVPDVMPLATGAFLFALVLYYTLGVLAAVLPTLFLLFTLYFFRNPERSHEADELSVISPADGVILSVEEVEETRFLKAPALKISIFLNLFNVHVNRMPVDGTVEYVHYQAGKFFPAYKGHASHLNERNYVGLRCKVNTQLTVLVVQITGFIARRIVCWVKEGDILERGQRFGMIKFGSCTEIYLPKGAIPVVKKGEKVKGGETIIGRLPNE